VIEESEVGNGVIGIISEWREMCGENEYSLDIKINNEVNM